MELVYEKAKGLLDAVYENVNSFEDRPFITLTFAQSLDGKISKKGQQVLISGKESLAMTHRLRTLHDGIMVGIGTALIDNPQLNARLVSGKDSKRQPQPIVLDPYLMIPSDCKLIKNYLNGSGKQLWLVVSKDGCLEKQEKKIELEELGVKLLVIERVESDGRVSLKNVFKILKENGINSLMIEGGSRIIQSCLKYEWDQLIITIGPTFIGSNGISSIEEDIDLKLVNIRYEIFGKDCVMMANKNI